VNGWSDILAYMLGSLIVLFVAMGIVYWFDGEVTAFQIVVLSYLISLQGKGRK